MLASVVVWFPQVHYNPYLLAKRVMVSTESLSYTHTQTLGINSPKEKRPHLVSVLIEYALNWLLA